MAIKHSIVAVLSAALIWAWTIERAPAAESAVDLDILASAQEKALKATASLYDARLSQPFVAAQPDASSMALLKPPVTWVNVSAFALDMSRKHDSPIILWDVFTALLGVNAGRNDDITAFINERLRPLILAKRDEFLCFRTRVYYKTLLESVDAYLERTNRDTTHRKAALICDCHKYRPPEEIMDYMFPFQEMNYLLALSWEDIESRGLTVPRLSSSRVTQRQTLDYLDRAYAISTPCGTPFLSSGL